MTIRVGKADALGDTQIISAARQVFTALESTLAASSTPFFFSSSTCVSSRTVLSLVAERTEISICPRVAPNRPTPLDAHLSALLSLVLYLPLPTPILADLINASFPRLWAHSALLRRTLWSPDSVPMPKLASAASSSSSSSALGGILVTLRELVVPSSARGFFRPSVQPRSASSSPRRGNGTTALTKKERDFARKRYAFFAVCAVGLVGWGLGTGAFPVPFAGKWARLVGAGKSSGSWIRFAAGTGDGDPYDEDDEEGEWEDELEDEDEDDLDDVDDD